MFDGDYGIHRLFTLQTLIFSFEDSISPHRGNRVPKPNIPNIVRPYAEAVGATSTENPPFNISHYSTSDTDENEGRYGTSNQGFLEVVT